MKISNAELSLIREFEGCSPGAYKCSEGVWTIGYGCTGGEVSAGLKIPFGKEEKSRAHVECPKKTEHERSLDVFIAFGLSCPSSNLVGEQKA